MKAEPANILAIDDDRMNRMLLTRSLTQVGHTIVTAENGFKGLELLRSQSFDVVLLDMQMPEMDGFEVLEEIMGDNKLRETPVIMVSAQEEMANVVTCIEMGATDYIHKPFDPALLRARIGNTLEKKRSRDQLAESYGQLRELQTLQDSLVHMLVHDLRTPLSALTGCLEGIEEIGELSEVQIQMVRGGTQAGRSLLEMINDLLDIHKMEGHSLRLDYADLSVAKLIDQALQQVDSLAKRKGLSVRVDINSHLPVLSADQDKLLRTLVNLLGNAVKFTPAGGTITASAQSRPHEQAILFAVIDSGEGIPQEYLGRIFEKFVQVEGRKSGLRASAGLGLTFCKMAVEAHGGKIWVESTLGEGSTFQFTIPCQAMNHAKPLALQSFA